MPMMAPTRNSTTPARNLTQALSEAARVNQVTSPVTTKTRSPANNIGPTFSQSLRHPYSIAAPIWTGWLEGVVISPS